VEDNCQKTEVPANGERNGMPISVAQDGLKELLRKEIGDQARVFQVRFEDLDRRLNHTYFAFSIAVAIAILVGGWNIYESITLKDRDKEEIKQLALVEIKSTMDKMKKEYEKELLELQIEGLKIYSSKVGAVQADLDNTKNILYLTGGDVWSFQGDIAFSYFYYLRGLENAVLVKDKGVIEVFLGRIERAISSGHYPSELDKERIWDSKKRILESFPEMTDRVRIMADVPTRK
jgi:hypothetical protein